MKKNVKLFLILVFIIILIFTIKKIRLKKYVLEYKINNYNIKEEYTLSNKKHYYDITISNKNNNYIFTVNKNLHKSKKIIKDIKTYKKNSLVCILPIYNKKIDNYLYCNLDNKQISIDYLLKSNNNDFNTIQEKAKKYHINYPTSSDLFKEKNNIKVYNKNIQSNEKYIIWDYKGIYVFTNNNTKYKRIVKKDIYDNVMSCIVDNYYVLFDNTSHEGIKTAYYYNLNNNKLKSLKIKKYISKDSYINGVIGSNIYITDNSNKKQFTINLKNKKVQKLNTGTTSYTFYNNEKKQELPKSDFFQTNKLFKNNKIRNITIEKDNNKVIKIYNKKIELLFELDNIKEWSIENNNIYILSNDTIYSYNEENGLNKIIEYNELNYNYKNIYKVWSN